MRTEEAEGIDEDRYYCKSTDIGYYYEMITPFFLINDIPPYFVFNVDEEGHDEHVDSPKKDRIVIPKDAEVKEYHYPVKKMNDHTTFVAAIAADGSYLKPLIVVKRSTIEARVLRLSIMDKVMVKYEESGYVNSNTFNEWITKVFIPEVMERRQKFRYTGPAVLILDGCPSHYTDKLFDLCDMHKIRIFFIPLHSSNQTQMLDLGTFHVHQLNVRRARLNEIENDDLLLDKIIMLFDSFQRSATYSNIRGAFEVAGARYEDTF